MDFKENDAIYLQIAAFISDHILLGKWPVEERVPSVRELAIDMEVNPNTVARAYEFLQNQGILMNKRGLGLFVTADSKNNIKAFRKERFLNQDLPDFFKNMYLLEIPFKELEAKYIQFKSENYPTDLNHNEKK